MNRLLVAILLGSAALAQTVDVRQVYVMPMAGGLDQYLAEWLTRMHVMQVVADPKAADAVLTDRLGESFEQKLSQIRSAAADQKTPPPKDVNAQITRMFASSRARGTVFLVDANSRQVLWSDREALERPSENRLNRAAERIVRKLGRNEAK